MSPYTTSWCQTSHTCGGGAQPHRTPLCMTVLRSTLSALLLAGSMPGYLTKVNNVRGRTAIDLLASASIAKTV